MLGRWDDRPIDPVTQRIILKIVGFLMAWVSGIPNLSKLNDKYQQNNELTNQTADF